MHVTYTKNELKNYLKDLVKGKADIGEVSFEYLSGHTSFHRRLVITIDPEKISHWKAPKGTEIGSAEEAKAAKISEKEFSRDELLAFIQGLEKRKIWDLENCTERALPDTAQLSFLIKRSGDVIFEQKIWESCRNDDDRTKDILRLISSLLPPKWTPP